MKVWIDNFTGIRKRTLILIRGFFGAILVYQLGVFLWGTSLVLGSSRIYVNPGEFIAPALVTFAAWLFATQKKQAILFLRHFGDEQANQVMAQSMYGALRRIARVVVLDDSNFKPTAVPPYERALIGGTLLVVGFYLFLITSLGIATTTAKEVGQSYEIELEAFLSGVKPRGLITTASSTILPKLIGSGSPGAHETIRYSQGELEHHVSASGSFVIVTAPHSFFEEETQVLALSSSQCLPLWAIFIAVFGFGTRIAFWSWEARRSISTSNDIDRTLRLLKSIRWKLRASRSLAPLATVIKTGDQHWKKTVSELIGFADWIVLDATTLSDSILWELELVLSNAPTKLILLRDSEKAPTEATLSRELGCGVPRLAMSKRIDYTGSQIASVGPLIAKVVKG